MSAMSKHTVEIRGACPCRCLHINCDPRACEHQRYALQGENDMEFCDLRRGTAAGCKTCSTLLSGLNLPHIKGIWKSSIEQAVRGRRASPETRKLSAEDIVRIHVLPPGNTASRVIVRTTLSSLTETSHEWRHFTFNAVSTADESGCRPFPISRCSPVDSTSSEESYTHLKQWLDICGQHHQCLPKAPSRLPKRVLRVSGNKVALHLSTDYEHASYMTLSHRWGLKETFVLAQHNLCPLTQDIAWSELPKTFQDTIHITRRLGIEYLWIDSLCIIQGDDHDWKEQSREMGAIYGNSWLNIAATDSNDSDGGCFRTTEASKRYPVQTTPGSPNVTIMPQPVHTHRDFGSNYDTRATSPPLLKRGWVFQERLLSPRIVYYAKDELLWECQNMSDCQCGAITVMARYKPYYHLSLGKGDPLPFVWMRIAERYSCMSFTYEEDRMLALAGVAKQALDSGRGGRYLAGVWEQDLAYQLCWTVLDTWRKPQKYLAPSWSWLSVFGRLKFTDEEFRNQRPSQIDVDITHAECKGPGPDALDTIRDGHIKLNGKTIDMEVEVLSAPQGQRAQYRLCHRDSAIEYQDFKPDYIMMPKEAVAIDRVTVLYWGQMWGRHVYMVLQVVPQHATAAYQRLGLFSLPARGICAIHETMMDACDLRTDIHII